jgi:predicted O-methyltransferase YrrM
MNWLPMLQHPEEWTTFEALVRTLNPRTILEIGAGPGGTTQRLGHCVVPWHEHRPGKMLSIDLPSGATSGLDHEGCLKRNATIAWSLAPFTFHEFLGDSKSPEALAWTLRVLGKDSVDVLFIDGDHTTDGVKFDHIVYGPLVRSGGIIAFHDIDAWAFISEVQVPTYWRDDVKGKKLEITTRGNFGGIGVVFV